jgi:hypothetical protein
MHILFIGGPKHGHRQEVDTNIHTVVTFPIAITPKDFDVSDLLVPPLGKKEVIKLTYIYHNYYIKWAGVGTKHIPIGIYSELDEDQAVKLIKKDFPYFFDV